MRRVFVGMSGWTYDGWRGDFYPKGHVQTKELNYASQKVNSIEINGTFYGLQKPDTFKKWYTETPDGFCFSVKAPKTITHIKRLKEVEDFVANFFASGLLCLKDKLGAILWQFPPMVTLKDDRFEKFFKLLPHDFKSAQLCAQKNTLKPERVSLDVSHNYEIRHAFEFRHPSFFNPDFIKLMRAHNMALVCAHAGGKSPYSEELTGAFAYIRMHGEGADYKKGYPKKTLKDFSNNVTSWMKEHDVYVYFDTEAKEFAPYDAMNLMEILKVKAPKMITRSPE